MKDLPRTRRASYEQGWEDGYARGETTTIEDLRPHLSNVINEMKQGWTPPSVTASMRYLREVINE